MLARDEIDSFDTTSQLAQIQHLNACSLPDYMCIPVYNLADHFADYTNTRHNFFDLLPRMMCQLFLDVDCLLPVIIDFCGQTRRPYIHLHVHVQGTVMTLNSFCGHSSVYKNYVSFSRNWLDIRLSVLWVPSLVCT